MIALQAIRHLTDPVARSRDPSSLTTKAFRFQDSLTPTFSTWVKFSTQITQSASTHEVHIFRDRTLQASISIKTSHKMPCEVHPDKAHGQTIPHKNQASGSHANQVMKRGLETSHDDTITPNLEISSATSTTHSSKEASPSPVTAPTVKVFPFFRLPRELRDDICHLNALQADIVCYDIELRALEQLRKVAYVGMRPSGALNLSQFEDEFVAAVGHRISALVAGGDRNELQISGPGPSHASIGLRVIRFEASTAERADGTVVRNVHAFELFIPFVPYCAERVVVVFVTFKVPDKDEIGPRS